jgi:hypothetical protein
MLCKIEKQTVNHLNMLTARGWLQNTDPAPEKGGKTKKQAPSKQAQ